MPADGAGRGAGRVEQDCVEAFVRLPARRIGSDQLGVKAKPLEVVAERPQPRVGAVDRHDRRAGLASRAVLPPGAAHRSATRLPATSPSRPPAMTPPRPAPTTRPRSKPGSASMRPLGKRRTPLLGSTRPDSRSAHRSASLFTGEIERRLDHIQAGDRPCARLLAPIRHPALPQPIGRVHTRRIEFICDPLRALLGDAPQHGIGKLVVALGARIVLREQ